MKWFKKPSTDSPRLLSLSPLRQCDLGSVILNADDVITDDSLIGNHHAYDVLKYSSIPTNQSLAECSSSSTTTINNFKIRKSRIGKNSYWNYTISPIYNFKSMPYYNHNENIIRFDMGNVYIYTLLYSTYEYNGNLNAHLWYMLLLIEFYEPLAQVLVLQTVILINFSYTRGVMSVFFLRSDWITLHFLAYSVIYWQYIGITLM